MFKHVIYETEIFKDVKDLDQFLEFLGELFNTKNKKLLLSMNNMPITTILFLFIILIMNFLMIVLKNIQSKFGNIIRIYKKH